MSLTISVPIVSESTRSNRSTSQWRLRLNDLLQPSDEPLVLRVFIGQPDADAATPTEQNPHFVGEVPVLANQHLPLEERAGIEPWSRRTSSPTRREFDPPLTLEWDIPTLPKTEGTAKVTLVALNSRGKEISADQLVFQSLEIRES